MRHQPRPLHAALEHAPQASVPDEGLGNGAALRRRRRARSGNYLPLFALMIVVLLGIAAFAVDLGMWRVARVQSQAVADAAAHAALIAYSRTQNEGAAYDAAAEIVAQNEIMGEAGSLENLSFGSWDVAAGTWGGSGNNAVSVEVARAGTGAIPFFFAPLFGLDEGEAMGRATAASRALYVVLVMDITGSWHQKNFTNARAAAVRFLDELHAKHGPNDKIGMVTFLQRYAWEYTPLTLVKDSAASTSLVKSKWQLLNVGSYAGLPQSAWATGSFLNSKHVACKVYGTKNGDGRKPWDDWCASTGTCYQRTYANKWVAPATVGGCFPTQPRYYDDEGGTDHTTGLTLARTVLNEVNDPSAYKAVVVLTDGQPVGYSSYTGSDRKNAAYNEARWREYRRDSSHSVSAIKTDTVTLATDMYEDDDINIWFVSFVEEATFMVDAAQGDGWFELATTSDQIIGIFQEIAYSLPNALVE